MTNSYSNTKEIIEIKKDLFAIKFQDKYIKIMKNTDNTGYNPPPWESFSYKQ